MLNHLRSGEITQWINKELPIYEFVDFSGHASYGNYNIFVILLTKGFVANISMVDDITNTAV